MKTPDTQSTFADLLVGEAAEDEQLNILKKRLLIPLGVIVVFVVAWLVRRHMPG